MNVSGLEGLCGDNSNILRYELTVTAVWAIRVVVTMIIIKLSQCEPTKTVSCTNTKGFEKN